MGYGDIGFGEGYGLWQWWYYWKLWVLTIVVLVKVVCNHYEDDYENINVLPFIQCIYIAPLKERPAHPPPPWKTSFEVFVESTWMPSQDNMQIQREYVPDGWPNHWKSVLCSILKIYNNCIWLFYFGNSLLNGVSTITSMVVVPRTDLILSLRVSLHYWC